MGAGLELVAGTVTAPGATITALTAATGQTFTIRNTPSGTVDIRLLSMWANNNAAGVFRIRSPRLHDNVHGIRQQVLAVAPHAMIPMRPLQKLYAQDALILELSGSAVAGQIETGFFLAYYQDIGGLNARFIDPPSLMSRGINLVGNEVDLTPSVAGGWTGSKALNANFDNLKANTDYAIMGATISAAVGAIGITGPDTGNLRLGFPGVISDPILLQEWFVRLSRMAGIPLIPVINSANKAGTTVDAAQTQAGAAVNVSLVLVELSPGGVLIAGAPR